MVDLSPERNSRTLLQFLTAWLEWAEGPADGPNHEGFRPRLGLCSNANNYSYTAYDDLQDRLDREFGFAVAAPFNLSYDDYALETYKHLNPLRLAWVRKTIAALSAPTIIESFGTGEGHYERPDGSEFHVRWIGAGKGMAVGGWYWWNVALMDPCCPAHRQVSEVHGPYRTSDAALRAASANDPEASDA